jgi:hypothetical protein
VVERVESESFWLLGPELTDPLKGCQASKTLESLREVVPIEKHGQMRAKTAVRVVVETPNRGVLDGAVHSFDLAIRPRMVELRQAMVDAQLGAGEIKGVGSEGPALRQQLSNLVDLPAAFRRCELKPVVPSPKEVMTGQLLP